MKNIQESRLILWPEDEYNLRLDHIRNRMASASVEAILLS